MTTARLRAEPPGRARGAILPPSYERTLGHAERIELASDRPIRERNKISYRFAHWPIWIWVFFIAPGPLTFDLFARGFDLRMALWLGAVLVGTGIAGLRGRLAGGRAAALHHPLHRGSPEPALSARLLHAGLERGDRVCSPEHQQGWWWRLQLAPGGSASLYDVGVFSDSDHDMDPRRLGRLPRVKASTQNEGHERRYFYGSVWAVCVAQPILWFLWKVLPRTTGCRRDQTRRCSSAILAYVGNMARRGLLPRTRPIVPGEFAVSD